MIEPIAVIVRNPMAAHAAIQQGWAHAKCVTLSGQPVEIIVRQAEENESNSVQNGLL